MEDIEKLKAENQLLKKSNNAKSDLISISAHQLRTSLSALKWILKMFTDEDLGKMSAEQHSFINKAYASNERMISLVNNLLTLNHSEDGSIPFKKTDINIIKIIEETLFDFSGEANKKHVEIIFLKPDQDIPELKWDEQMMHVVIQNLIENALKYSEQGGKIFISLSHQDFNIELSIRDGGLGIKEEDKDKIFNKFFRTKEAKEKETIGSGLGLFTTKTIVEKHGGKIWFESEGIGKGTTFFMSLPTEK